VLIELEKHPIHRHRRPASERETRWSPQTYNINIIQQCAVVYDDDDDNNNNISLEFYCTSKRDAGRTDDGAAHQWPPIFYIVMCEIFE